MSTQQPQQTEYVKVVGKYAYVVEVQTQRCRSYRQPINPKTGKRWQSHQQNQWFPIDEKAKAFKRWMDQIREAKASL